MLLLLKSDPSWPTLPPLLSFLIGCAIKRGEALLDLKNCWKKKGAVLVKKYPEIEEQCNSWDGLAFVCTRCA